MKRLPSLPLSACLLIAAMLASQAAFAAGDEVAGTWLVKGRVNVFAFTLTCKFEQHGKGLGGVCYDAGTNKAHPLTAGSVEDGKVAWTYQSNYLLTKFNAGYAGVLEGGTIKGAVTAPGYTGVFTATRE